MDLQPGVWLIGCKKLVFASHRNKESFEYSVLQRKEIRN